MTDAQPRLCIHITNDPMFAENGYTVYLRDGGPCWIIDPGLPPQPESILEHIRDTDIPGVVWISGDVHFGMVGKVDRPGGAGDNQWEVVTGSAGSRINPVAQFMRPTERKPVIVRKHNWVLFEADPDRGAIQVQYIGNDGGLLASRMLRLG